MKKISYILVSRNDNYCGDSVGRLVNTLNHTGSLLVKNGVEDQSEVVLIDWASPEAPLLANLPPKLNKDILSILKIVTVSPTVAAKYQQNSPFSEVHAMNCGFRRMRGEYFGRIDQDTLMGQRFVDWFYNDFKVKDYGFDWPTTAFCSRRNLDEVQSKPHHYKNLIFNPVLSRTITICHEHNHFTRLMPRGKDRPVFHSPYGGAVGILLVQKDAYEKHKGFNEQMVHMNNMDVEFFNRLTQTESFYNLNLKLDCDFYHQYHSRHDGAKNDSTQPHANQEGSRQTNDLSYRNTLHKNPNNANWGLLKEDLSVVDWA